MNFGVRGEKIKGTCLNLETNLIDFNIPFFFFFQCDLIVFRPDFEYSTSSVSRGVMERFTMNHA